MLMAYPFRNASPALPTNACMRSPPTPCGVVRILVVAGSRPTPSDALQGMRLCQHILIAWCDVFMKGKLMLKKSIQSKIFQAKLDSILLFDEANDYTKGQMAHDACHSSWSAIQFKKNQMSDQRAIVTDFRDNTGSEVMTLKVERAVNLFNLMKDELDILTSRHEIDLDVYRKITEEDWKPKSKGSKVAGKLSRADVDAVIAVKL